MIWNSRIKCFRLCRRKHQRNQIGDGSESGSGSSGRRWFVGIERRPLEAVGRSRRGRRNCRTAWWMRNKGREALAFYWGCIYNGVTVLSTMTFSIMARSIKGLFETFSITMLCHHAECHILFTIMLSVVAPSQHLIFFVTLWQNKLP